MVFCYSNTSSYYGVFKMIKITGSNGIDMMKGTFTHSQPSSKLATPKCSNISAARLSLKDILTEEGIDYVQ